MGCVVFTIEANVFFAAVEAGAEAGVGAETGAVPITSSFCDIPVSYIFSVYFIIMSFCLLMTILASVHTCKAS